MKRPVHLSRSLRWVIAVAAVALATVVRMLLAGVMEDRSPLLLYTLAVTAAAAYGGRGPGLLATVLSAVTGQLLFISPFGATAGNLMTLALFILTGAGISLIGGRVRGAMVDEQKSRVAAEAAEKWNRHLLDTQLSALRTARIATWDWILSTAELEHNGDLEGLTGSPAGTFEELLQRIHEDDRERTREQLTLVRTAGEECSLEFRVTGSNGEPRWMSTHAAAVRAGRVTGVTIDITAERAAQDELALLSNRLQLHLENVPVGVVEYAPDFTILRWSSESERMFGWSAAEVVGRKAGDFRWMHEDDMPALGGIMNDMLTGTRTRYFSPNRNWTRDGRVLDVEWYNSALRDARGQLTSILSFAIDVTARTEAERRLRESRQQLRELADSLPQLVWVIEADGELSYVNHRWSEYFGITKSTASHGRWLELVHHEDRQRVSAEWDHSLATGEALETEYRLRGSNGEYRWFLGRAVAVREADGRVARWFRTSTDLHTLRTTVEALGRSNEDLRQFAYAVSHDLQEPMRTVNAYTQLLARTLDCKLDPRQQLFMSYVTSGAKRVMELLTDLRQFLEISEGDTSGIEPVDVEESLASAVANLEAAVAESGATIRWDRLPVVCARQVHVVQILQNLLGNAIKYRSEVAPVIEVSAMRQDGFECLAVRDNGIGIPSQYHARIFGVFKRLHGSRYPGTGMGLAICQRIVERYGGRIWVESEPAKGSTFLFTLPAAE